MESELYFPSISDIFNELENNRTAVFPNASELVEIFFDNMTIKTNLDNRFLMLIPTEYWENAKVGQKARDDLMLIIPQKENKIGKSQKKSSRSSLSNLHTGKKGNSSAAAVRCSIAEDLAKSTIKYLQQGRQHFIETFPISALSPNLSFEDPSLKYLPNIERALKKPESVKFVCKHRLCARSILQM